MTGLAATSRVYDATTVAAVTGTASVTVLAGDQVTLSGTATGLFASKAVGTSKSVTVTGNTISGTDAGNYTLLEPTSLIADITPKPLTVSGVSVAEKVYDGNIDAVVTGSPVFDGKIGNDDVGISIGTLVASFDNKNVGTNKAINLSGVTLSGADSGNYTLSGVAGLTASITPATLTVSGLTASNKAYDSTTVATLTGTASVTALGSDQVTANGVAAGIFADKNVATGKVITVTGNTLGGTDAGNYILVQQPGLTADITPAMLTVTAYDADKVNDGIGYIGGNGVAYNGFVNSENNSVLNGILTYSGTSQGAIATGSYVITPSGYTSTNYRITFVNGKLTITGQELPVPTKPTEPVVPPNIDEILQPILVTPVQPSLQLASFSVVPPDSQIKEGQSVIAAATPSLIDGLLVRLISDSSKQESGLIGVSVPSEMVRPGTVFSFQLPIEVRNVASISKIAEVVSLADGTPLPGWLRYDSNAKAFTANDVPTGALPLKAKVIIGDLNWTIVISEQNLYKSSEK